MEKDYSDEEKQSVTHYSVNKNEVTSEEWQLENPKDKIIEIISEVEESSEDLSDYDKLETIKKRIKYYLFEN